MTPDKTPIADLAWIIGSILVFFFGISADSAHQIGQWLALLMAAFCGAVVALKMAKGRFDLLDRLEFLVIRMACAFVLTTALVKIIAHFIPNFGPNTLIVIVAFVITCDPFRQWVIARLKREAR